MNPLLNGMNDKQSEAVQTTEGPLLIMAGAGAYPPHCLPN